MIFVRESLCRLANFENIYIECFESRNGGNTYYESTRDVRGNKESAKCLFNIFNVNNDERVVGSINERKDKLRGKYDVIFGLRDIEGALYKKQSNGSSRDDAVVDRIIKEQTSLLEEISEEIDTKICLCFSVMEIEAWFFGMKNFIKKLITEKKTAEDAENAIQEMQKKYSKPEEVLHPKGKLISFLKENDIVYSPSRDSLEGFFPCLEKKDLFELRENNAVPSFDQFIDELIATNCFAS